MARVENSVVINRPVEEVFAFMSDVEKAALYESGVEERVLTSEGPMGVGSTGRDISRFLGRRMEYTPEVIGYEPGKLLEMSTDMPFEMTIRYEFEDADGGTLARIRVQGEGSGFYRLAAPLLARMVKRNVSSDLRTLKRLLESSADTI